MDLNTCQSMNNLAIIGIDPMPGSSTIGDWLFNPNNFSTKMDTLNLNDRVEINNSQLDLKTPASSLISLNKMLFSKEPSISAQSPQQQHQFSERKKLFVGNLPCNTTLGELVELFGQYGPVNEELSIVKEDNYAFVHFYEEKDANAAFMKLNDSLFKNRYIRVQYSTSQGHIKKSKTFDMNSKGYKLKKLNEYKPVENRFHGSNQNLHRDLLRTTAYLTNSQSMMSFGNLQKSVGSGVGRPIKGASNLVINKQAHYQQSSFNGKSISNSPMMPISQSFQHLSANLVQRQRLTALDNNSGNCLNNSNLLLIPTSSNQNTQNKIDLLQYFYQQQYKSQAEIKSLQMQLELEKIQRA